MKKRTCFIVLSVLVLMLTACGSNSNSQTAYEVITQKQSNTEDNSNSNSNDDANQNEGVQKSNILIVYFTVPETDGVDAVASASRVVTADGLMGNTQFIATEIQKNLGGELLAIKTEQEYPGTHDKLLDFAYNEKSDNARPKLATHIDNLDDYDYIFVGYPNWNADLPMPLYSFFEEYDFSGKTIIPFVTHGGSGFSGTINTIKKLEPDATVIESGLSISRNNVSKAQSDIKQWTDSLISD